jgi:ring-1,2-phenylacetyl-CoA epoxidase subunit PaaC
MFTGEQFEMDDTDSVLIAEGIAVDLDSIRPLWSNYVENILQTATIEIPKDEFMQTGSRKGIHTEHLGHLLSEMQYLQRAYPDAQW